MNRHAILDKTQQLRGELIGEKCPKCGASLLENKRGDKWCSNAGGVGTSVCEYGLKDEPSDQQIITELATKVMGWERKKDDYVDWWMNDGVFICRAYEWNPLQNIADAWMLVEKFKNGDPIVRAKFAVSVPVLIYKIEPKDICYAALSVIA